MREGEVRVSGGCAIACIFHADRERENGKRIVRMMEKMHNRSNGLGAGYVGYGIYPQYKDAYALHVMYEDKTAMDACEQYIRDCVALLHGETIPTKETTGIDTAPLLKRYFVMAVDQRDTDREKDLMVEVMFTINKQIAGAYVFSCGKNMGVFKGVGYPEDIAAFYQLEHYEADTWIAHGRYPTNTPGWWAGAHPFSMLDFALVHNGEISSYETNRRYMEMHGYPCSLLTDTEVITYMLDFLMRKQKLSFQESVSIIAAPFWEEIEQMDIQRKMYYTMLRRNFSSLLINGPFSIILGSEKGIMACNDRLKLRSLLVGKRGATHYLASEECAIQAITKELDDLFSLDGGVGFEANYEEERL